MRLDPAIIADDHVFLNFYKWAHKTIVAQFAFVNIRRLYDSDIFPENHVTDTHLFGLIFHGSNF